MNSYYPEFPDPIYAFYTWNTNFYEPTLRFTYESLTSPYSIYELNMDTGNKVILKQQEIMDTFDSNNYISERIFADAIDGSQIPISIVYKKDLFNKDGNNPVYLTAYGAYGDNSDPYFSTARLSLLDRGIIYAIAHVRGGKEMGEHWYEQGKMLNKKNTFTDFIACSEFLKQEKYAGELVIDGGSAGGLLMGAVTNMRPDLFQGVIADVPFVDVLNSMMDPTLSAVVSEYEEWGNPNDKTYFNYIRSYSPYDNVTPQDYPHLLVLAGFYDTRVNYWEPAKWVAKLRANKTNDNLLLLQTNMNAGHGGSSGRYDYLKEIALSYTFVLDVLGIKK
jgi:oligopeptidase B